MQKRSAAMYAADLFLIIQENIKGEYNELGRNFRSYCRNINSRIDRLCLSTFFAGQPQKKISKSFKGNRQVSIVNCGEFNS